MKLNNVKCQQLSYSKLFVPEGKYLNKIMFVDRRECDVVTKMNTDGARNMSINAIMISFRPTLVKTYLEKETKINSKIITQNVHCKHPSQFADSLPGTPIVPKAALCMHCVMRNYYWHFCCAHF